MAWTSSIDLDGTRRHSNSRERTPGYTLPGPPPNSIYAVSSNCTTIPDGLIDVAGYLSKLDFEIIRKNKKAELKAKRQSKKDGNTTVAARIEARLQQLTNLESERKHGPKAMPRYTNTYLTDEQFGPIWKRCLKSIKALFNSKAASERSARMDARDALHDYVLLARKLSDAVMEAAKANLLDRNILSAVGDRWIQLYEAVSFYHKTSDIKNLDMDSNPKIIDSWYVAFDDLCIREANHDKESMMKDIQAAAPTEILVKNAGEKAQGWSIFDAISNKDMKISHATRTSWSSIFFLFMTMVSVALFGIGYGLSTHERGTTADANFWFSAQTSVAQLTGLASSAVLEWRNNKVPERRWMMLCGLAASASLLAMPIYVFAPTEWSTFLTLTATMIQSGLIMQRFIFEAKEQGEPDIL